MRGYDPDDMDCCNYGCPPIYDEDIEKAFGVPTKDDIIKLVEGVIHRRRKTTARLHSF